VVLLRKKHFKKGNMFISIYYRRRIYWNGWVIPKKCFDEGLLIWHYYSGNIVVNAMARVGEKKNCVFCTVTIAHQGITENLIKPYCVNNVDGVGAIVIGDVYITDNISA
jgi:serine acetyltransferase